MSFDIRFTIDDAAVRQALKDFPKQARFAVSLALTRVAKEAQGKVVGDLPKHFTIRTPWVAKGIRIVSANPRTLEAVVYSKDDFMAQQEAGGKKKPRKGKSVSVPFGARRSKQAITRPGQWPKALLEKPDHFITPLGTGGLYMGIEKGGLRRSRSTLSEVRGVMRRYGEKVIMDKGRYKGKERQRMQLLYVQRSDVDIKPRFLFRATVEAVARASFSRHFEKALSEALTTARP